MLAGAISKISRVLLGDTRSQRLLVLIYHRVRPGTDELFPDAVVAATFRQQMTLITQYCSPLKLSDAVQALRTGNLPERACAVTFDDGYADNATVALPILQQTGVSATFFVATAFLNGGRMWNDSVIEAIRAASSGALDVQDLGLGLHHLDDLTTRRRAAMHILAAIKHLPLEDRQRKVDDLCAKVGAPLPTNLMMTDAQVLGLAQAGMEIGGHTVNHPILRNLSDETARDEIASNRQQLESIIGAKLRGFAYPNGRPQSDYTQRDRDIVEQLGFEYAVSTQRGVGTAATDRFQIPRYTPWDRDKGRWLGRLLLEYRNAR